MSELLCMPGSGNWIATDSIKSIKAYDNPPRVVVRHGDEFEVVHWNQIVGVLGEDEFSDIYHVRDFIAQIAGADI